MELKIFRLNQSGIPQDRIAKRLGLGKQRISRYLPQMPQVAKSVNRNLSKDFTVPQVAQKNGRTEPLVWSQALVNADDFDGFKALQWRIRTWDVWNFTDCDNRFGDERPGRIHVQLVAHILYFFQSRMIKACPAITCIIYKLLHPEFPVVCECVFLYKFPARIFIYRSVLHGKAIRGQSGILL